MQKRPAGLLIASWTSRYRKRMGYCNEAIRNSEGNHYVQIAIEKSHLTVERLEAIQELLPSMQRLHD